VTDVLPSETVPIRRLIEVLRTDVAVLQGRRAGLVSRGVAWSIDFGVVLLGPPLMFWGFGIAKGLVTFTTPGYPDPPPELTLFITAMWTFMYFIGAWWLVGRTVGMAMMALRLVGRVKPRVRFLQALIRYWVLFATILIAPVWLFFAKSRLALHDRASRTQMIYDRNPRRSELKVKVGPTVKDDAAGPMSPAPTEA